MDRIFEVVEEINDRWIETNKELKELSLKNKDKELKNLYRKYNTLRSDFANTITLGQDDAWRFFAEANGVTLPDE